MAKRLFTMLAAITVAMSVFATPASAQQSGSVTQPAAPVICDEQMDNIIDLLDGRSCQPRTTPVNSAVGSPLYQDTGVGLPNEKDWEHTVPNGYVLIYGGVTVNDNVTKFETKRGMLGAKPAGTRYDLTVVDGFMVLKPVRMAKGEFCMRLVQHLSNGWLISDISVLPEWKQNQEDNCWDPIMARFKGQDQRK